MKDSTSILQSMSNPKMKARLSDHLSPAFRESLSKVSRKKSSTFQETVDYFNPPVTKVANRRPIRAPELEPEDRHPYKRALARVKESGIFMAFVSGSGIAPGLVRGHTGMISVLKDLKTCKPRLVFITDDKSSIVTLHPSSFNLLHAPTIHHITE